MSENRFDAAAHARSMRDGGYWIDKSFDEFLQQAIAATPGKLALLADRADRAEARRFTYAELGDLIARAAAALKRLGIGPGDVVSVQLPNWWEFAVISLAAFRVGAVVNPLMPIFREHELGYMLDFAETRLMIVPKSFRGFDHEAMVRSLQPSLPKLQHLIVVDGEGANSFDQALLSGSERLGPPPAGEIGALPADQMAVLMFTSGTTGSPKGVMHCLNTLLACNIALAGRFGLDASDTMLVCSPLGHMTGFAAAMLLGLKIGASVIFQDVWEPKRGVGIMANEGVTYSAGAATFLADMCEAVAAGAPKPGRLRKFLCAGAPIPPAVIDRVYRELDLKVCSLWGMTESLSSTLTEPERALEKSSKTDGRPLDGVAVKVLRMDGSPRRSERGGCSRCAARRCASATTSARIWSLSMPKVGSTPATWPIWTTRGTSASTAASRTSSFAAARTCRYSTSRICCSSIRPCFRPRSSDIRTRDWESAPAHSWCCVPDNRWIWPPCRPSWPSTRSRNNIGPNGSRLSTTCQRPQRVKFGNSSFAK